MERRVWFAAATAKQKPHLAHHTRRPTSDDIMAMIRSLTRQLAGLAVASQPRVAAIQTRTIRTFPGLVTPFARPAASLLNGNAITQMQIREMGTKYKLKSKSAVKKRFKVNSNGLVKRAQANKRHIATKKTRERIRRLGKPVYVEGKIRKNILAMLPGRL